MLGGLGVTELVIILVIIMIVFGVGKLPEIGGGMGQAIKNFKKASREPDAIDVTPDAREDLSASQATETEDKAKTAS